MTVSLSVKAEEVISFILGTLFGNSVYYYIIHGAAALLRGATTIT